MTTIINTPPAGESGSESAAGIIIGVIFAIVLVALFVIYGIPALRSTSAVKEPTNTTINVTVPPVVPPTGTTK